MILEEIVESCSEVKEMIIADRMGLGDKGWVQVGPYLKYSNKNPTVEVYVLKKLVNNQEKLVILEDMNGYTKDDAWSGARDLRNLNVRLED